MMSSMITGVNFRTHGTDNLPGRYEDLLARYRHLDKDGQQSGEVRCPPWHSNHEMAMAMGRFCLESHFLGLPCGAS